MNVPRGDTYITGHITIVRHGNLVNAGYSNHNATSCLSFLTNPNSFFNLRHADFSHDHKFEIQQQLNLRGNNIIISNHNP